MNSNRTNSRKGSRRMSRSGSKGGKGRKGPNESATAFKPGTIRKGNDGRDWIIKDYDGVQRWVPLGPVIDDNLVITAKGIQSFDFNGITKFLKLTSPKKIGQLNITSNSIGVGELIYNKLPAQKGKYDIYLYDFSLIAVHEKSRLVGQRFNLTKFSTLCDIGMFSFNDAGRLENFKPQKNKRGLGLRIPEFSTRIFTDKKNRITRPIDAYYIYESDFEKIQDNNESDTNDPVAIFAGNGYGDGSFSIYQGKGAYLIMSAGLYTKIYQSMSTGIARESREE